MWGSCGENPLGSENQVPHGTRHTVAETLSHCARSQRRLMGEADGGLHVDSVGGFLRSAVLGTLRRKLRGATEEVTEGWIMLLHTSVFLVINKIVEDV